MATNPRRKELTIGIREHRVITIWPLSLADEVEFAEKVLNIFDGYDNIVNPKIPEDVEIEDHIKQLEQEDSVSVRVAAHIINAIKENLIELLGYVCDEEVTLRDLDNEQFADVVDAIYEMNYAGAVGKFKAILGKAKKLFPQTTPSPNSSSTPATDTNTSTDSDTEKEE